MVDHLYAESTTTLSFYPSFKNIAINRWRTSIWWEYFFMMNMFIPIIEQSL